MRASTTRFARSTTLNTPMDTVSKMRGLHPNSEMAIIGYVIGALIALAMLPLLPFFLLYLLADWLTSVGRDPEY
ncbi:DUF7535 family protein [Halosimplex halophilum]